MDDQVRRLAWDDLRLQQQGDYWASQGSSDLSVELLLEKQLWETACTFFAPNVQTEFLRLQCIATLQGALSFLEKYRSGIKPIGEKKDQSLLHELKLNIELLKNNQGFDDFQLWELYNAERLLVLIALGEIGFRKNKKGVFSWLQKQQQAKEKLIKEE